MDEQPRKSDFVKFQIDGVRLVDIEKFDELAAKLISSRDTVGKARKDAFYFCYFLMRTMDDVVSKLSENMGKDMEQKMEAKIKALEEKICQKK